ncbi:MAG: NAD(+) synthase [Flavobacteriaceae bacterium]|nr:NAD(+) synthase [Flavobacteriales bacterium]RCL69971.1 MAG: NAD(+) synthase [Bacteroidota bacterium]|tara:strand:+ start:5030 stop:5815 length:786 start_codon:yes stop_codon:yes gene_type:complete
MKTSEIIQFIVDWIINYKKTNNINGLVVGVSGGIDSALTSTLCGLTGIKTLCLNMPIKQNKNQYLRAQGHIKWLKNKFNNIDSIDIDLTKVFNQFKLTVENSSSKNELALANSRSRIRMMTLYYYASIDNSIVVGTGNKVEDFGIGFYTKYGDGGVDISPIADLMKSEVFQMSKLLEINEDILKAKPTDGLWDDDRSDEEQIGASYRDLENVMNMLEKGIEPDTFEKELKRIYDIYIKYHKTNKHKMIDIPVCKIPEEYKL